MGIPDERVERTSIEDNGHIPMLYRYFALVDRHNELVDKYNALVDKQTAEAEGTRWQK
jgi:hypothetical protein